MNAYSAYTDQELVFLLKEGDRFAFTEVYDRYSALLIKFAANKLYDLDDCKDLIQDLFVNLWTEREHKQFSGELKAYLYAVTRHKIIDKIRKNVTREEYSMVVQSLKEHAIYNPEKDIDAKELEKVISLAIEQLPPRVKEIYKLSRNEYMSISEIATQLNISDQTVKNQLSTAMKSLRETISRLAILLL
ncbi:RNA polymerase sigma factor [Pedobacter sp. GR22-6]|uniref:RNA polymerase sigma factor n=1 Tax=Pedobacter sp. GR22-6 TaxID=3127957 RepID=UPI00307FBE2E